ncbi:hypothetical protein QJS66_06540 [Kocuria rhizophila]|nr:hypothetical protein QJS66_06540 [Kocuria rhizophila]
MSDPTSLANPGGLDAIRELIRSPRRGEATPSCPPLDGDPVVDSVLASGSPGSPRTAVRAVVRRARG